MYRHNDIDKMQHIAARVIKASVTGRPWAMMQAPTVKSLEFADKIIMLKAMEQTEKAMDEGKLMGLAPAWKDG